MTNLASATIIDRDLVTQFLTRKTSQPNHIAQ